MSTIRPLVSHQLPPPRPYTAAVIHEKQSPLSVRTTCRCAITNQHSMVSRTHNRHRHLCVFTLVTKHRRTYCHRSHNHSVLSNREQFALPRHRRSDVTTGIKHPLTLTHSLFYTLALAHAHTQSVDTYTNTNTHVTRPNMTAAAYRRRPQLQKTHYRLIATSTPHAAIA